MVVSFDCFLIRFPPPDRGVSPFVLKMRVLSNDFVRALKISLGLVLQRYGYFW